MLQRFSVALWLSSQMAFAAGLPCATAQYMQWANQAQGRGSEASQARAKIAVAGRASRPLAERPFARTWTTSHFAIHYSLYGLHQVKTQPEDSLLLGLADSLRKAVAKLPEVSRDSAVYHALDKLNAPHPVYIQIVAAQFEAARAYYVDTLNMRPPKGTANSLAFQAPVAAGGLYVVDVDDIGSYNSHYNGPYYGLTLPPPNLAIVLENDFIYNTRLLPSGKVAGDTIRSLLDGKLIHNYASDFEIGLRITIYHEFYHAIQFTYVTEHSKGYHAWYELSAVGMEERKVPEGNDYLQYLPCLFQSPGEIGLFDTGDRVCDPAAEYSNATFHLYLTQKVGADFDTKIWDLLSKNGDVIQKALPEALNQLGSSLSQTFPDYAANLLLAGKADRPDQFESDMPLWPTMQGDSLDPETLIDLRSFKLPPLSYLPIRLPDPFTSGKVFGSFAGDSSSLRVLVTSDTLKKEVYPRSNGFLQPWKSPGESWLVLTNLSPSLQQDVTLSAIDIPFLAYPNPLSMRSSPSLHFTRSKKISFPLTLEIVSEAGLKIYSQKYAQLDDLKDWDLKNQGHNLVSSGIYHLRINQGDWQTLLLLP
jgi:catechol 2,3-dioxygenase-like lactoylglutathione lyase family enzyme